MSEKNITIRLETENDYRAVENLTRESFWNVYRPGCMEHYVLHCYRDDPAFDQGRTISSSRSCDTGLFGRHLRNLQGSGEIFRLREGA